MVPVNNSPTTNEITQPISDAFLKEKYRIPEQYSKDYPEDSVKALLFVRLFEEISQAMDRSEQADKELSNGITRLEKGSKILLAQQASLIELEEKNTQALRNLRQSSSEIKGITWNVANIVSICANRIFNPIKSGLRGGFCFLIGHRAPAAILSGENPLAIEYNPENSISNTDPTNQSSVDEKKNCANLLKFCVSLVGLYILYSKAQSIFCCSSAKE